MAILQLLAAALLLFVGTMAEIQATTSVSGMLDLIPGCAVSCVMNDIFVDGDCPLTTAGALSACTCTNVTMQSQFSACVQTSCIFLDQQKVSTFAASLCEAYPKESRLDELKVVASVTIALTVPFLALRLYARWLSAGRLQPDDIYAILAATFLIAVSIVVLRMTMIGFGLHYWNVAPENGVELLKLFYVSQMLYVLIQIFSKLAILALYARLFSGLVHWFRWSVRVLIIFMYAHGLLFILLVVFQCTPINSIWDKTIDGKCLRITTTIISGAGFSIAEDFIILLLPIRELWKLQMSTKKKAVLVILISAGSFSSITSIVRLKFILKYSFSYDPTWDNVDVIKWSLIENVSASICGNLLPLRPLFEKLKSPVRSMISFYSNKSRTSSNQGSRRADLASFSRLDDPSEKLKSTSATRSSNNKSLNSGLDWKDSSATELVVLTPPPSAHIESGPESPGRHMEASTTVSPTAWGTTEDAESTRQGSSEGHMIPPCLEREHRVSGPWSSALTMLER